MTSGASDQDRAVRVDAHRRSPFFWASSRPRLAGLEDRGGSGTYRVLGRTGCDKPDGQEWLRANHPGSVVTGELCLSQADSPGVSGDDTSRVATERERGREREGERERERETDRHTERQTEKDREGDHGRLAASGKEVPAIRGTVKLTSLRVLDTSRPPVLSSSLILSIACRRPAECPAESTDCPADCPAGVDPPNSVTVDP